MEETKFPRPSSDLHLNKKIEKKAARILCVDDEPMNLRVLDAVLGATGYELIKASDGIEAIQTLESTDVDLVLLDVMMPGIDGYDVCRRIKGDDRFIDLPVIMLTALTAKEDRIRGIDAGADDFISKPFDKGEVLARIRMLLKMRNMSAMLRKSYGHLAVLTAAGEGIADNFKPAEFEVLTKIDHIVNILMTEAIDAPEIVVFTYRAPDGKWMTYRYNRDESHGKPSSRATQVEVDCLSANGCAGTYYWNASGEESIASSVKCRVESENDIINLVCYAAHDLRITAMNYRRDVSVYDTYVLKNLVVQVLFMRSLALQINETQSAFSYTVFALARAAEANDDDTGAHIMRVGEYCAIIAGAMGMADKFVEELRLQAPLHDVGKVHIHPDILRKPGKLTPEEWGFMRQHTSYGVKIIGEHGRLSVARSIAMSHHEKWDGSGYPNNVKGADIPIEGRIMTIGDQYDALRSKRAYKPAFDHDTALRILIEGDGRTIPGHFDPDVHRAFKDNTGRFEEIFERLKDKTGGNDADRA